MNFKRTSSRFFSLICLLGFLLQLQQVFELYFRYETTSRTVYQNQEMDYYQSIMYCPKFIDLLAPDIMMSRQITALNIDVVGNFSVRTQAHQQYMRGLSAMTVKEILQFTPLESEAVENCDIRLGKMSIANVFDGKECREYFEVVKSVNGERICYTFVPKISAKYSIGDVASSLTHIGEVYKISLVPRMSATYVASFISSPFIVKEDGSIQDPLHSRSFMAKSYSPGSFNRSRFLVFGESNEIHRLPPPYDTKCTPRHNIEMCYEQCLIKKFKEINRIPWSGFHREKLDMKMLTATDFLNETIKKYAGDFFEKCHSRCKLKTECLTQFSKTTTEEYQGNFFILSSMLPAQPNMSLYSVPFLNLIEFIVQVGSCIGMWFGLSIISFNPVKWKTLRKKGTSSVVNTTRKRLFQMTRNRKQLRNGPFVPPVTREE